MPNQSYDQEESSTCDNSEESYDAEDLSLGLVDASGDAEERSEQRVGAALNLGYCSECGDEIYAKMLTPCDMMPLCEGCAGECDCNGPRCRCPICIQAKASQVIRIILKS